MMEPTRATPATRRPRPRVDNLLLFILPALILIGLGAWVAARFVQPAPPEFITISTGSKSGGYFAFGGAYRTILARSRIKLEVRPSKGTVENLARLGDESSGVSVAFVQGGVAQAGQAKGLLSLGRIFHEPLWVFYRGSETITTLTQLDEKRLAIGPKGSGTRALVMTLLQANEITAATATFLPLSGAKAAAALRKFEVDAVFLVASPKSKLVMDLLHDPSLRLMSFARAAAYARKFPYLARVELPRGVVDLVNNVPARDVQLIAPVAALVVRSDLHSALASLLAEAAAEVHKGDGLLHRAGDFPRARDPTFEMSADAARIYKSGVPFLRRYLPFWLVVWVQRLAVMLVPVLTILLPLMKILPLVYRWRMRRRILRWYVRLQALEGEVEASPDAGRRTANLAELERIDALVREISVPLEFTDDLYTLRQHIELVRRKLENGEGLANSPIG